MEDFFMTAYYKLERFFKRLAKPGIYVRFWQRLTRGWDDSEVWNLDTTFALFAIKRLKRFKEVTDGIPSGFNSMEEWHEALDKMIASFEFYASDYKYVSHADDYDKQQEGLDLFAQHYGSLWW